MIKDTATKKRENRNYRETKERSEKIVDKGRKRVLLKQDDYGWKRALVQSKKKLWVGEEVYREIWKTEQAIKVGSEKEAWTVYRTIQALSLDVEFEKMLVAYRKKPLNKQEKKAYEFGRWLKETGWWRLGNLIQNVFVPGHS